MATSIRIVREPITLDDLRAVAAEQFGEMVKAVVDVSRGIMAIGGELAMINVRPTQWNRSRSVEDPAIQARIREVVVARLVHE